MRQNREHLRVVGDTELQTMITTVGWTYVADVGRIYTVGLTELGLPELLIECDDHDHGQLVLTAAAQRLHDEPDAFTDGRIMAITLDTTTFYKVVGPTQANFKRATAARRYYAPTHKLRVVELAPA